MATYSIGTPPTDATKLLDLQSALNILPDNTSKLIQPKDVRDSIYTLWENIIFKPTTALGTEYIGVDQTSVQKKIYFGKKTVGGQYVLNNNLLSTDVDVFFYNTKTEPQSNYNTTVAFLAGTSSNYKLGQLDAPYIKSTDITNPGYSNTIDFEIINPSYYTISGTNTGGNINIYSQNGNVVLNGTRFPTYTENTVGIAQNNYVLKYKWIGGTPYAKWEINSTASVTDIISTGTVSITGSPVLLNGIPINFSYNIPTPVAIGGIPAGSTFSNVPVTEMIRMILYPYIEPLLSTSMNYTLIEIGDGASAGLVRFNYTITRNATYSITGLSLTNPYTGALITPGLIVNGVTSSQVIPTINMVSLVSSPDSYGTFSWTMNLNDTYPTSKTSTSIITAVLPWYYGTATISSTQSIGMNGMNTILGTQSNPISGILTPILANPATYSDAAFNKTVTLTTSVLSGNQGYIYFGYPSDYADLQQILDPNGYDVTGSFYKFTISGIDSPLPNLFWSGRSYKFYIYVGSSPGASTPLLTTIGSLPSYSGDYQFKFV
jgi:hypothetical protein